MRPVESFIYNYLKLHREEQCLSEITSAANKVFYYKYSEKDIKFALENLIEVGLLTTDRTTNKTWYMYYDERTMV